MRRLRARERALENLVAARTKQLETAYAQIEEASLTDPLTGLRNRRFLEQTIAADLELASRGHGDLVVLLADLDHFKSVNDTHGHAAGDAVLAELARLLVATFRASDYVVRWGGEEFLIVVRFVDRATAGGLAEKLRAAVAAHSFPLPDGTILRRTCSIGFSVWPQQGTSWDQTIDRADAALYAAKRGGRNAAVGAETLVA
ncbi:MAG TPA: GGDEF domain-containing protein [Thermoanaerobaculia bacterium]|nr:GGDEF domain-containing protein [Thermoanaerobaculia bacterium]